MNTLDFDQQFARLIDRWKTSYSNEFKKILWTEFQNVPGDSFKNIVTRLIGDCRQAPMMPEFREYWAMERNRLWVHDKKQNTLDAKSFFEGSRFSDSEKKNFMAMVRKRLNKAVSDDDWNSFLKVIEETNRAPIPCVEKDLDWG
jgi:hypothetical protein